jgi:hypothetical protein
LRYNNTHRDVYTHLSKEELYEVLKQKAKQIRDDYIQEQSERYSMVRLLFSDETPINDVFARIESPATRRQGLGTPVFPIDPDTTLKVLEKIKKKDLYNFFTVSHQGNMMAKKAFVAKTQKLVYEDNDYEGAILYKKALKREINLLWKFGLVDQNGVTIWPSWMEIEDKEQLELALKKTKNISNEYLINLCSKTKFYGGGPTGWDLYINIKKFLSLNFKIKASLGTEDKDRQVQAKALCQAARFRNKGILKLLLKMGVNPASQYKNRTALDIARETGNAECIEILTQAIEKRFFENKMQSNRLRNQRKKS